MEKKDYENIISESIGLSECNYLDKEIIQKNDMTMSDYRDINKVSDSEEFTIIYADNKDKNVDGIMAVMDEGRPIYIYIYNKKTGNTSKVYQELPH